MKDITVIRYSPTQAVVTAVTYPGGPAGQTPGAGEQGARFFSDLSHVALKFIAAHDPLAVIESHTFESWGNSAVASFVVRTAFDFPDQEVVPRS